MKIVRILLLGAVWLAFCAPSLVARQGVPGDSISSGDGVLTGVDEPLVPAGLVTPGGAFLRSVLVPGWGHVATESYSRAGFYVTAQAGSLWMLLQTLTRKSEAEKLLGFEREVARARLETGFVPPTHPDSLAVALAELATQVDADPDVLDRQALVDARGQQVEDWSALSIFLILLGAADAFVAAHLAEYPDPLTFDVQPRSTGGVEVRLSVPIGP